jgi:signal transduction histidine kinase/DNA-binding response OmpR family regulator
MPERQGGGGGAILLVDDRPDKLLALEAVLEDLRTPMVRAESGREALRHVLNQEFAVILLDVNMPGMDGFETAALIRQRASSRHTPIIFITAFGDEMHAIRSYSLGAVDFILAPVVPEILRTKVAVFVDLFAKTEQIKRQAETLQRRASQMQTLAAASLAINSALSIDKMLQTITDTARTVIGSQVALTLCVADWPRGVTGVAGKVMSVGSFGDKYAEWRGRPLGLEALAGALVARGRTVTRLSESEVRSGAEWAVVREADLPPARGGLLIAPLAGRDGSIFGVLYLTDPDGKEFTDDDEAVLMQVAHMGSIAIENTLYAQERQANRIKDEFLATLSHELRTPLNAIIGWVQLLQLEPIDGQVEHGLAVIDRNARAQNKLIEDLLDASRITSGKLSLNLERSTLAPIVRAMVEAARPAANAKQIEIEVRVSDDLPAVMIDPHRIQQVISNLLSNATKFTPAGGKIRVELERVERDDSTGGPPMLALRVSDTGQGIDGKFLPFVFDRFRQADSSSTRGHGGLGLGLTIVRHIVDQHGGRVVAESEGTGRGATLIVELPVARPTTPAIAPAVPDLGRSASANGVGAAGERASLRDVRVLLVDDEADAREMIGETLRRAGATVRGAGSVSDAMETLGGKGFRPDLILSDIAMPGEDGYVLIGRLRRRPAGEGGDLPAVALTAYARDEDRARALAAGFDAHLAKPIDPPALVACIAQLVAARGRLTSAGPA